jgi:hypothetical protein
MNKFGKGLLAVAVLAGTFMAGKAWADQGNGAVVPGSAEDPIVTKSYVDEQIQQALGNSANNPGSDPTSPAPTPEAAPITVVELKKGQTLYGFSGTEFIVRSGTVIVVAGANGDGLPDVTDGVDLKGFTVVKLNHLLVVPRNDGRGLRLSNYSKTNSFVMVRGKYELK